MVLASLELLVLLQTLLTSFLSSYHPKYLPGKISVIHICHAYLQLSICQAVIKVDNGFSCKINTVMHVTVVQSPPFLVKVSTSSKCFYN